MKYKWIAIILLLSTFPILNMIWNNWNLFVLANQFQAKGHPQDTVLLEYIQAIGNINGTHNQCDFFVAQLRSYIGNENDVRKFYSSRKTIYFKGEAIPLKVTFFKNYLFDDRGFDWINEVNQWFNPQWERHKKVYVVYLRAGGYAPGMDCRCH